MPNPFHFRSALNQLARLAARPNPAHVRLRAVSALAEQLSPANPRHGLIQRMLQAANPYEFARHQLRDLYDRADPLTPQPTRIHPHAEEEELTEEADDPL